MEKEVVDLFHQSVEISIWLLSHPREWVVDGLFEAIFSCDRSEDEIASELDAEREGPHQREDVGVNGDDFLPGPSWVEARVVLVGCSP